MPVERPLSDRTAHICVDMQKMFMPPGPWAVNWLPATLPRAIQLVEKNPARTIFRFSRASFRLGDRANDTACGEAISSAGRR